MSGSGGGDEGGGPALPVAPFDIIGGERVALAGDAVRSINPARPEQTIWLASPALAHVDAGVRAARGAFPAWRATPREARFDLLRRFGALAKQREQQIGALISAETGKALWESAQEAALLSAKVEITLDGAPHGGLSRISPFEFPLTPTGSRRAACDFRPHGVMAVIGPFNFPAHLPNGHIVPALAAGNCVVFKPSDKAPGVGQALAALFVEAGFPPGVVNLVHGGAESAARLTAHPDIDGVLFTGSWPVGRAIMAANLDRPGRILALEMGGDSAAVVMDDADLRQACVEIVRCAFNTTGQRCTSTRRVIVQDSIAERFIKALAHAAGAIRVGEPHRPDTFMGPIIRAEAREATLRAQRAWAGAGAETVLESRALDDPRGLPATDQRAGFYLSPGISRVDRFAMASPNPAASGCGPEVFGPLLRVSTCRDLDDALEQANATRFGLAASIFTRNAGHARRFTLEAMAGCVNVNTGTAGASSKLPFGGLGLSGNHRPAGAFSLDYCAYPVASMAEQTDAHTLAPGMRFDDAWLG